MRAIDNNIAGSRQHARRMLVSVQLCLLALIVGAAMLDLSIDLQPDVLIYPACLLLLSLFCWSLWSWKVATHSLFDPYGLFLIAAFLFNAGQAFLEVFHLNQSGVMNGAFTPQITLETLFLVLLCLAALHLGALVGAAADRGASPNLSAEASAPSASVDEVRWLGWSLLLISVVPAVFVLRDAVQVALSQGYAALYSRAQPFTTGLATSPKILATFLVPAALFLLVGGRSSRITVAVSAISVLGYSVIYLFLGARSTAVMPLLMYAWLWDRYVRRIPRAALIGVAAALMFFVFPLIAATRNISGSQRLSLDFLVHAFSTINNPVVASISEMGGSMVVTAHTLILVPSIRDFDFGAGYLWAAFGVIPNLFWTVNPAYHADYSGWLIPLVDPGTARAGGGLGFNFIAEAYLNFGWLGAPVLCVIVGFLLVKFVFWALKSGDPARSASLAAFFVLFAPYVRNEALYIFRPLVWYAMVPYLLVLFLRYMRRPRTAAREALPGSAFVRRQTDAAGSRSWLEETRTS